ncbi:helix-turn-helix domain-containing protein [Streptomyces sp. SBST2-5]|uniref:Helix-turn-helix domain-containing protein n=1 Tax=Streptomyces composti TaxID=2720025 RepID=A0ABX1A0Y9_9ACTN|nr:helix-turn-helix domain-containing protein [Streptomyces composti]NJP50044.1 helix-turn-helix domain-containing protein [Streptomyces composti]
MLVTEFSTQAVAPPERFALFEEVSAGTHLRNLLRSDDREDFRARLRVVDLGELQLSAQSFPHLEVVRTAEQIRRADPEVYMINCVLHGQAGLSHTGRHTTPRVGDLVVLDSSRPFEAHRRTVPDGWSQLTVQLPHRMLPLPERTVRQVLALPIDGRSGMGGVFARWLGDLNARADEFTAADVPALTSVILDLLASVIAGCLQAEERLSPKTRRTALRARIQAFVERHLADPDLTPRAVAEAHHISLRHLQQLFAEDGTSPAAWIRHRRLERCRRDLADPGLDARPVQAIAARWGFTDPAHFSRLFRAAYGMPPREYRTMTGARRNRRADT